MERPLQPELDPKSWEIPGEWREKDTSRARGPKKEGRMEIDLGKQQGRRERMERLIFKLLVTSSGIVEGYVARSRKGKDNGTEALLCGEFQETRKMYRAL